VLLCLDYDGTISEIVEDPALARPVPGVLEVLAEFGAQRDRTAVAIVSGREVATLREILHVRRGIALSGIHGLELVDFEGSEEIMQGARECTNDLDEARKWLDQSVPAGEGFVIENKRFESRCTTVTHPRSVGCSDCTLAIYVIGRRTFPSSPGWAPIVDWQAVQCQIHAHPSRFRRPYLAPAYQNRSSR
jgi:trehalose-phosphatase